MKIEDKKREAIDLIEQLYEDLRISRRNLYAAFNRIDNLKAEVRYLRKRYGHKD